MKVFLYTEGEKLFRKSGLGKAIKHQMLALEKVGIEYTTNIKDDWDIVHINFYGPNSYAIARLAKLKGKKVVYHAHSTEEDYKNGFILSNKTSKLFKYWITKCYNLGDVIITPTPYSKSLLETYKINKKIYSVSNGIDMKRFRNDKELGIKFRKKYNYSENDKVIIGIGLYIERKGIVDFVELAKQLPDYKFIWFGHSPAKLANKKVRKAVNTKLDNLTFAGYVEHDVIIKALNGCDLYLFPTYEETEGIPVLEASACKTKMLIRDIGVFNDWLEDSKNVYKASTLEEFKDKIIRIVNNKLPDLTEEAYKIALERDIEKVGKRLKEIYEELEKK